MSGSIPLRDPAWDGAAAPHRAGFAHAVAPGVADWITARAWPDFGAGPAYVLGALREADTNQRTGHYLVEADGRQYVLHVKRTTNAGDAALAASLSDRLAAQGLPVARYRRTRGGDAEIAVDGLMITATDFVAARHRSGTVDDATALGSLLGRLHAVLRDDVDSHAVRSRNAPVRLQLRETVQRLRSGEYASLPDEYRDMARAAAERFDPDYGFAGYAQRLHGDVTPGNVLFLEDGSARLCDLENSAFFFWPATLDLASAVLRFCIEPADMTADAPAADTAERRHALTQAYAHTGGQAAEEDILDRGIRNLVDHNIVVRCMYELDTQVRSPGEWRKIARLDRLAGTQRA